MARKYQVHLIKAGVTKDVVVVASSQSEAKRIAESQNPGFKESGAKDLGPA